MAVLGVVTACAAAAVLALTSSSSSNDDRPDGVVAAEAASPAASPNECAVCLSEMAAGEAPAVRTLPGCGHGFHEECIGRWLRLRPHCPLCRCPVLLAGGPAATRAVAASAPAWARPARIACGFGDGRVVWTRSPSAQQ